MSPWLFVQILSLISTPIICILLGKNSILLIRYGVTKASPTIRLDNSEETPISHLMTLGLLIFVTLVFVQKCLHIPWMVANLSPILLCLFDLKGSFRRIKTIEFKPTVNFCLWFIVILYTGISLFEVTDGIRTIWVNNYGDLAYHMGMITSFVFGDNFPPQYHIFPGETLSYPFFVNVWTAMLWWPFPSFATLSVIFCFQWVMLWSLVYVFLNGNRYWLIPWAVFFGGATYAKIGMNSGPLIPQGFPWSSFLTTIWVTQRGALFGLCCLCSALKLFHQYLDDPESQSGNVKIIVCGLTLALMPLVHTHFLMVGVLYVALVMVFKTGVYNITHEGSAQNNPFFISGLFLAISMLPGLLFLNWLSGKSGILHLVRGWTIKGHENDPIITLIWAQLKFWTSNAPAPLLLFIPLWWFCRKHIQFFVLALLFALANYIQIAVWDWDQIKVFLGIYIIFLLIWSEQRSRTALYFHILAIFLIIPGVAEFYTVMREYNFATIYMPVDLTVAEDIRNYTEPTAIFAAKPNHNSVVTLSGRRLFSGYDGTLASHGLKYEERKKINEDLGLIRTCKVKFLQPELCPQYILWTNVEREYWKVPTPGDGFSVTPSPYIFKVN